MDLGFGNIIIDDIFFVPGYNIHGYVVSQVIYLCTFFYTFTLYDTVAQNAIYF